MGNGFFNEMGPFMALFFQSNGLLFKQTPHPQLHPTHIATSQARNQVVLHLKQQATHFPTPDPLSLGPFA